MQAPLKYLASRTSMSRTQVQLWFKECRDDVNDDARPGRPSTSTTEENMEVLHCFTMILDNCRITIREVVNDVDRTVRFIRNEFK